MGIIDIIILIIIIFCFIKGYSNGLIIELGHVVGLLLGLYLALNFTEVTLDWIGIKGKYRYEIAFAITMLVVVICVALFGRVLTKFVNAINLSFVNRFLGGTLNIITSIILLSLLLNIFESFNGKSDLFDKSIFDTFICQFLLDISNLIFPYIDKIMDSGKSLTNEIINI